MTEPSLRDAADAADAERFVGRQAELALAADLLADTVSRVLFVHGPGGIGKSALLRAIRRMARARGFSVTAADPRGLTDDVEGEIGRALESRSARTLLVVDEADLLGSSLAVVRDRLLDDLPSTSRLLFAGREGPDRSWRADGLDAFLLDVTLPPLDDDEADALLAARGVDESVRSRIVSWAQGSPLALTVAAAAPRSSAPDPASAAALEARLTSWLAGSPMLDVSADALAVAALAPAVDARLIAAALPSQATRRAMRQLEALPVVERASGGRLVLHAVLASAIRARLEATAPDHARVLRRRIVEHLASRARLGDIGALVELSQFIEDPKLRQAVSNRPSPTLFPSTPEPGELDAFARQQGFDRGADWAEVRRWFEVGAPYALCVRRRDSSIVLYAAFATVAGSSGIGPVTASLLTAAEATQVDPPRSFIGVVLFADASEHDRAEAARLGTGVLMHQHGIADLQAVLIHYPAPDRRPLEALAALAAELPDDLPRMVALSDFRPLGAVGFIEHIVLGELGIAPPAADAAALLAVDDDPQRQAHLRAVLDQVFGPGPQDQRLRKAIELAHLSPRQSEAACLEALHVSRSTWFRLLRTARERVLAAGR